MKRNGFCYFSLISTLMISSASALPYDDYHWLKICLPKDLLREITMGVRFALESGAARKISEKDLDHFHILVDPCPKDPNLSPTIFFRAATAVQQKEGILSAIDARRGIMLHSQEHVNYGRDNYCKRNIVVINGQASIVFPKEGQITVFPEDLGYELEVLSVQGYIVDLAGLDPRRLKLPENIIRVGSKKLYVGFARE